MPTDDHRSEIEITPEMIEAGARVLWQADVADGYWAEGLAETIFREMYKSSKCHLSDRPADQPGCRTDL